MQYNNIILKTFPKPLNMIWWNLWFYWMPFFLRIFSRRNMQSNKFIHVPLMVFFQYMQNKAQCITFYFDNLNINNMKMHFEIQCAKEINLVDMQHESKLNEFYWVHTLKLKKCKENKNSEKMLKICESTSIHSRSLSASNFIKIIDFYTLCTAIPHSKLKQY